MPRPRLRLSLMILFPSIYNVTVSVKENKMEGETITEKIPEASFMHKVLGCGRWWPRCFSKLCLKSNLVKKGGLPADPRFQWGIEPWSHYLLHGDWSLCLVFSSNQEFGKLLCLVSVCVCVCLSVKHHSIFILSLICLSFVSQLSLSSLSEVSQKSLSSISAVS